MRRLVQRWFTVAVALVAALVMVAPALALAMMPRPVAVSAFRAEAPACDADRTDDEHGPADRPVAPNLDEEEDDDDRDEATAAGVEPRTETVVAPAGHAFAAIEHPSAGHWTFLDTTPRPPRAS